MGFYIEKIILHNRAPFNNIELDFDRNDITILNAVNGGGKTTIISHIVDAWHEMARPYFQNEFKDKPDKFYRVSSSLYNLDRTKASFVYVRFKLDDENIDYLDIRQNCTEQEYNDAVLLDSKIPFTELRSSLASDGYVKKVSSNFNKEKALSLFNANLITHFPSYRFETPGFLNAPYAVNIDFNITGNFAGYLPNQLEVVSGLPHLANWIMDIVLDWLNNRKLDIKDGKLIELHTMPEKTVIWNSLNEIVKKTISAKISDENVRLGIGKRNTGKSRISVTCDTSLTESKPIYPSIFELSSGESAILTLFGEILLQADKVYKLTQLAEITGLVIIDEIDKHLHISLQKEVLPHLFALFPNVQFIVSSHSPFVSVGLQETQQTQNRIKIRDLDNNGMMVSAGEIAEYNTIVRTAREYKKDFQKLILSIDKKSNERKLQIVTEGKNTEYIKHALTLLDAELVDKVEMVVGITASSGCDQLKELFKKYNKTTNARFLFVFDGDVTGIEQLVPLNPNFHKFKFESNLQNTRVKNGIENLFSQTMFTKVFCEKEITTYNNDGTIISKDYKVNKTKFREHIKTLNTPKTFKNFNPLIEYVKNLLNTGEENG